MADTVTAMVIKVDLQCDRCRNKIRKVLSSFPEIRDQIYDEKQNSVMIKVVSCCPDKILKKICSKGGKSIEKIEIVPGEKKKDAGVDKTKEGGGDKAKEAGGEKKKDQPQPANKEAAKKSEPKKEETGKAAAATKEPEKKEGGGSGGGDKSKDKAPDSKPKEAVAVVPASGYPSIFPSAYPMQAYYDSYYPHQVHIGGSQYHGMPDYYVARDGNHGNYYGRQCDYFSEENQASCTVM
ncbi:hypothetical protein SAY86_014453 [Trapa natans]|uniref:HMA domain-containing protein n=1 Tax=Trapa natans TaxID=22666 RepID=A0AAN7KN85_TRANT|nr:hypothetical protein SAY86_014453 [Trapa natans]